MPPDDTDGLGDDLPGLHDDQLDDADLPGLDEIDSSTESDGSTDAAETLDGDVLDALDQNLAEQGARFDAEAAASNQAHAELDEWHERVEDLVSHPGDDWDRLSVLRKTEIREDWEGETLRGLKYLPRWMFVGGGFGILGLVLIGFFVFSGGDTDDTAVVVPSEVSVLETAPPSTEAVVVETEPPALTVDDEPAAVAVPQVHTIDVAGEEVDLTVWLGPTATNWLVAAPSLNSNVEDLARLAATLAGQDCANVVAFDSSLTSAGLPIFDEIIDKWLDGSPDAEFSTLGSSATAKDALIAGINFGAKDVYLFSPSEPFDWESISPPIGITYATHVVARITTGDSQYRPIFDGWIEADLPTSFESYVVEGDSHGTAFFNEAAAEPVLNGLSDHICHFIHDDFEFPEGFEQGDTSAWRR